MNTPSSTSTHAARITRVFKAPRERVYDAFTNADIGKQWWFPEGTTAVELVLDARPGGTFRFVMHIAADDMTFMAEGVYKEVVPNERLVWTNHFETRDGRRVETLVTLVFTDVDGGTQLDVTHDFFPEAAMRDGHQEGWGVSLDGLERLLA